MNRSRTAVSLALSLLIAIAAASVHADEVQPSLKFSSFLGQVGYRAQRDPAGNLIVMGENFVGKLNAARTQYLFKVPTSGDATAFSVDDQGNVYVAETIQRHRPVSSVSKISPTGEVLLTKTVEENAFPTAIAVDHNGNIFVASETDLIGGSSSGQMAISKLTAFGDVIFNIRPAGTKSAESSVRAIAVDALGTAFFVGTTNESQFATTPGAFQQTLRGGSDAYVFAIGTDNRIRFSTLIGGSEREGVNAARFDHDGNLWIGGWSISPDFPGATVSGSGYAMQLTSSGYPMRTFRFSAEVTAFCWNDNREMYVGGFAGLLSVKNAFQPASSGRGDGWIAKLDPNYQFAYASYLGGSNIDLVLDIAPTPRGVVVAGATQSSDFPVLNAINATLAPNQPEGFITEIEESVLPAPSIEAIDPREGSISGGTAVIIRGRNFASGAAVFFGNQPATRVVVESATSVRATTPATTLPVVVDVRLQNADGQTGLLTRGFTYASCTAPMIIATPIGADAVARGSSVALSVTALGTAPLTYQWYAGVVHDIAKPIDGATTPTFNTPPLDRDASYWVRVSNGCGFADSTAFALKIVARRRSAAH